MHDALPEVDAHRPRHGAKGTLHTFAILDERDACRAIGVVLYALHNAFLAGAAASQVDQPEQAFMAAASMPRCDPAAEGSHLSVAPYN